MLNDWDEQTKDNIHIMVTSLCDRNCPHCCNKQYDLATIPYVTDEELKAAKRIFITGGEPFEYSDPLHIARHYKTHYPNIESVIVYTNAWELADYMCDNEDFDLRYIDGVNVSIKAPGDIDAFEQIIVKDCRITELPHNRLYVFGNLMPKKIVGFEVFKREWQTEFIPANDSIFRRI